MHARRRPELSILRDVARTVLPVRTTGRGAEARYTGEIARRRHAPAISGPSMRRACRLLASLRPRRKQAILRPNPGQGPGPISWGKASREEDALVSLPDGALPSRHVGFTRGSVARRADHAAEPARSLSRIAV